MQLERLRDRRAPPERRSASSLDDLLESLSQQVSDRFRRMTGHDTVAFLIDGNGSMDFRGEPRHPHCADYRSHDACRECWRDHLAQLEKWPEPHWGRCELDKLCAVVPLTKDHRCVAMCKLVCPDGTAEREFLRDVELLELLVENFAANKSEYLRQGSLGLGQSTDGWSLPRAKPTGHDSLRSRIRHPLLLKAAAYVDQHFADRTISVASVARYLGVNSTYLAHLFSTQVGVRMSRYIGDLRIERAQELLAATNWQIKRVAFESGHANPDWFSQVFRARVGMSPREYRRQARLAGIDTAQATASRAF